MRRLGLATAVILLGTVGATAQSITIDPFGRGPGDRRNVERGDNDDRRGPGRGEFRERRGDDGDVERRGPRRDVERRGPRGRNDDTVIIRRGPAVTGSTCRVIVDRRINQFGERVVRRTRVCD
jgi:hypothetical protein